MRALQDTITIRLVGFDQTTKWTQLNTLATLLTTSVVIYAYTAAFNAKATSYVERSGIWWVCLAFHFLNMSGFWFGTRTLILEECDKLDVKDKSVPEDSNGN